MDTIIKDISISIIRKRLFAIIIAITFLFLVIFGRLFYVQVYWGNHLQAKAIDQWTREIPVVAKRGKIVDENGIVLVKNDDTYSVFARKNAISNIENTAFTLASTLSLSYEYVLNRLTATKSSEVTIKKQVKKTDIDNLIKYNLDVVESCRSG